MQTVITKGVKRFVLGCIITVLQSGMNLFSFEPAQWNPQTTEWSQPLQIGDWGIDRPGFPQGLYIHGITVKEGKKVHNPVIYDNDVYDDVIDAEWMFAMASLKKMNLVAQILTPLYAEKWKFYWGEEWIQTAHEAMENARKGGIDMKRIPPITIGTEAPDEKAGEEKQSKGAHLYVKLINDYYKKNPDLPVIINIGGQCATLASAWCLDNSIAQKCIVYYTDLGNYNGDYRWASELVAKQFRVVNFGPPGAWWKSKLYQNQWNVFPRPDYPEADQNDVNSGEWKLLTQTGNYMLQYIVKDFFKNRKEICLKGWKADGYCDGTFIHAWLPGIFSGAEIQTVRGGQVLQITQFDEENEKRVKQFTMAVLLDVKAYPRTKIAH